MVGVVVDVKVYGRVLGVLTTGILSNNTRTTRGPYDIPLIPHYFDSILNSAPAHDSQLFDVTLVAFVGQSRWRRFGGI